MSSSAPVIFDRRLLRARRARHSRAAPHVLGAWLVDELIDRLSSVTRPFEHALVLGPIDDLAPRLAERVPFCVAADLVESGPANGRIHRVVATEEALPFAEGAFDLIVSALSLHWINDLPGALIQIRRALKPDGLFLASLLGGDTLAELRDAILKAEIETAAGVTPRFSPTVDMRDMGALMQRAGFALPVVDNDKITLTFETPLDLMQALRMSGETNALVERRPLLRSTLARSLELYDKKTSEGEIAATFQVIHLSGWSPHESQQKPLQPGTARMRLADALGTKESSAGEGVGES